MKKRIKSILIPFMLLATLLFVTACAEKVGHYDGLDAQGMTVSVRFDANGGTFTTNVDTIVDAYDTKTLPTDSNGNYVLSLLDPNNEGRGSNNKYLATKDDYFLAGWYTKREETGEKDIKGNPIYSYEGKWDFENDTELVKISDLLTSNEPVLTLYAAWVPRYEIKFLTFDGEQVGKTYTFNPLTVGANDLKVPCWNDEGAMEMYKFEEKEGYTFSAAYYDKEKTRPVTDTVIHTGNFDEATGTATNTSMEIYVEYVKGNWYHVYNVEQFKQYATSQNSLILHTDLDFENKSWSNNWPTSAFVGTIEGNGHTISNVKVIQDDTDAMYTGLFGSLTETAVIKDLHFTNVTFVLQNGPKLPGTTYGLLAGSVHEDAVLDNVTITDSKIQLDAENFYVRNSNYSVGLIFGDGYDDQVDYSGISCEIINQDPEKPKFEIKKDEDQDNLIQIVNLTKKTT